MFVEVESSWIKAINYFEPEEALEINLLNGETYVYFGVSFQIYEDFLNAESKGKFYNNFVKGFYNSLRVGSGFQEEEKEKEEDNGGFGGLDIGGKGK